MKSHFLSIGLLIYLMQPVQANELSVNTLDLLTTPVTADSSCLDYCFEGVCFWLKCRVFPPSCEVKTSLRVSHNNPDFVVSAFPDLGDNPWKEFTMIFGDIQKSIGEEVVSWIGLPKGVVGSGEAVTTATQGPSKKDSNGTTFKEVDVVGYYYDFSSIDDEYFCASNTTPFTPHYSSAFDGYLWRTGLTDFFYTPLIFIEAIGIPYFKEWGGIYWRTGFIKQLNPAKANAVLSMRGLNIASRGFDGRVAIPATGTPSNSGQKFFSYPGPSKADGSDGSVWQMIAPKKDNQCYVFDDIAESENSGAITVGWAKDRWSENQSSSVYLVWRPYECCKKKGQLFLFSVPVQICIGGFN